MSQTFLAKVWRKTPPFLRRWAMRFANSRYTVSAGAVVFREDGKVLLLDHRFRPGSGWGVPGGFLDRSEQPETAVRRELKEETGLELTEVRILLARTVDTHLEIIFVARSSGTPVVSDWEIASADWFDPAEMPPNLSKGQRELIERAIRFVAAKAI
jgi:ADP-ribose pyrophosphatase YjhB (NUDIX family)